MKIRNGVVILIFLIISSNFLLFYTAYPTYFNSNINKYSVIDEVQGKYITSISDDNRYIGILYSKLNQNDNIFITYADRRKIASLSLPNSLRPIFLSDSSLLFVNTTLVPVMNTNNTSTYETSIQRYNSGEVVSSTIISLPIQNITSSISSLKIEDIRMTSLSALVFCSFNLISNNIISLYSVLLEIHRNSFDINRVIIHYDQIYPPQSFIHVRIDSNFVFISDNEIQGSQDIVYYSSTNLEMVRSIDYTIENLEMNSINTEFYTCRFVNCNFAITNGKIINLSVNNQSLNISLTNQSTTLVSYNYPGNATFLTISSVLKSKFVLFYPQYVIDGLFDSAIAKNSYYYIFDISNPGKLMKVFTNPNKYDYFRLYFKTLNDGYLTIVSKYTVTKNFQDETHFTIIRENNSINVMLTWIRDNSILLFFTMNLVYVFIIILIKKKKRKNTVELYPDT